MTDIQEKYICGICGVTAEKCGSWCQCSTFGGYVCSACCWNRCCFKVKFDNCSITYCNASGGTWGKRK